MVKAILKFQEIDVLELRFCADCTHYQREKLFDGVYFACRHPNGQPPNLITGEYDTEGGCEATRSSDGRCGPEGRLWAPRTTTPET